jgi:transposase-like protein
MREFTSLIDLTKKIRSEQDAIDYFTNIRWRNGAFCPYCGTTKVYHFSDKRTHKCGECRQRFSIKVGTVFEDSKVPMRKWLMAIWLLNHSKGIASTQLAKDIGVTQKTAWFMNHRIRSSKTTRSYNAPLKNVVEADETFIGGKEANKHARKRTGGAQGGRGKEVIFGMLERGGNLVAMHLPLGRKGVLKSIIQNNVAPGTTVVTDEFAGYAGLPETYQHQSVNHSAGEYVRDGYVHTNGIEGAWSLLKRQIYGIHHWVSPKHLARYVDEMTWRYNRRQMSMGERVNALIAGSDGRLTYRRLTA